MHAWTSLEIALKHFKGLPPAQELPSLKSLQSLSPPPLAYQLLQRSMVRPHPRAQLFELPKGSRAFATHPANLPLIAYDPDKTLDVRPLAITRLNGLRPGAIPNRALSLCAIPCRSTEVFQHRLWLFPG